jgi:glycosyltransferase involved in cell wall biosynthesis
MKILVFNWQDITNPLAGGAEVHLHEVFSRIARRGHSVTLYCSTFPGARHTEILNGINVIREGGRYFFNYRAAYAYAKRLRHEGFDVVVDDMNKIPFFTPLFVRKPLLGITHHLFSTSIFRETNPLLATYVYVMERLAVWVYRRKGIRFIVGSPSTARELAAEGFPERQVTLIPYAVDHELHRQSGVAKSSTPLIGYFGRLKRYKSIDHLLQVLPAVLERIPALRLMIVGEGDDRPRLEALSREMGLTDRVTFTGFVDERTKVELLQTMWVKVTTSSKEGWGLTVLEANACGTPVVASNVPGLRDAVRDNETGLLYRYGDLGDLAAKIVEVVTNTELRERLTREGLRWAREFDWERSADQTLEVLNRMQRDRPRS